VGKFEISKGIFEKSLPLVTSWNKAL
jgi:hypothetical protein